MRAMILAAGRGERMRPLTDVTPKPLLDAGGKPLIQYHIENLASVGVREILINLAWKGAMIREALGNGARFGVQIRYSDEGDTALETGGGIFKALPLLGADPFIVVSGDIWTDYRLPEGAAHLAAEDIAHFVLVPNPDFHAQGDFGLHDRRITEGGPRYTYANIGIFRAEFFAGCNPGCFPLAPLMYEWVRKGRVGGELFEGRWRNVGTLAQLALLNNELRNT